MQHATVATIFPTVMNVYSFLNIMNADNCYNIDMQVKLLLSCSFNKVQPKDCQVQYLDKLTNKINQPPRPDLEARHQRLRADKVHRRHQATSSYYVRWQYKNIFESSTLCHCWRPVIVTMSLAWLTLQCSSISRTLFLLGTHFPATRIRNRQCLLIFLIRLLDVIFMYFRCLFSHLIVRVDFKFILAWCSRRIPHCPVWLHIPGR